MAGRGAGASGWSRRGLSVGVAAIVVVALVLGGVIGRITAPQGHAREPAQGGGASHDVGPSRTVAGVPVGYARTREGAVAALLNYSVVLSGLVLKPEARRSAALAQLGTPSLRQALESRLSRAAAQAAQTPVGRGLRTGATTVYRGAPLGYRVIDYTPDHARVETWAFGVVANDQGLGPQITFQSATSTLRWQRGDWKLDRTASRPGPTPATAGPVTSAQAFVQTVGGLQGLRYAP